MIKANSRRSPIFELSKIATLKIPSKLRLNTEYIRLLVQAIEYKNGQYRLQCRHGRLSGRYQGGKLNVVDAAIVDKIGSLIRTPPEQKGG
jgi:hypothetical protein